AKSRSQTSFYKVLPPLDVVPDSNAAEGMIFAHFKRCARHDDFLFQMRTAAAVRLFCISFLRILIRRAAGPESLSRQRQGIAGAAGESGAASESASKGIDRIPYRLENA